MAEIDGLTQVQAWVLDGLEDPIPVREIGRGVSVESQVPALGWLVEHGLVEVRWCAGAWEDGVAAGAGDVGRAEAWTAREVPLPLLVAKATREGLRWM